ncbi:UDP-forming cellulose synthase catalytic subunit [Frateuria defendens]|uniref:UDP-forming cellulose synthase catalytic subunit n=1 Tax=Frateuria defendens TaxID=2219559 RepID=UPI00066FEC8E|nr:UDP-forming cellulose synthase catalytic subunit [Frateuria defendens]
MSLAYRSYRHFRQQRGAAPATALWCWLLQGLCWLLLPLEGPAWRRALDTPGGAFAHLDGRRLRFGDPLRVAIQAAWLLLVRTPAERARPRAQRLKAAAGGRWRRLWQRGRQAAGAYAATLHRLPARVRGSAPWQALRRRANGLRPRSRRWLTAALALLAAGLALLCVTEPFGYLAQFVFVLLMWVIAMVVRRLPGRLSTLVLAVLSITVSCRYLWWRYTATLNWNSPLDFACGMILLAAETYSWLVLMLGYVQTIWPLQRKPASLPADLSRWPSVDVLIPTYNEDLALVRHTVYAAMGIDWPKDKLRIHILDDGRRPAFREFAQAAGVGYIARTDNRHAKAGNLNHALPQLKGELVAIFDSDHLPARSFLQVTVGWFLRDRRLALVQTPHHFFSPDPFERNLGIFRHTPNEGELFYGLVQDGNDLWDAAFFCGSCAVLRRAAIDDIGGFAVETVTEDAHTALRLHRRGWHSAYLRIPQAAGLATGSLAAHVSQRIRWARGMAQIFRIDNPLFGKGLSVFQRLCYANAMLHFLAGLPRLVFLTAPLAFLLLHVYIIYAPALAILLFVLPHMIHASLANARLQGVYRRPFWGEVYETVLAWYIARPTTLALINPKKGAFNVTAKDEVQSQDWFDWRIAKPYLLLAALNVVGLGFAAWRLAHGPADEIGTLIVSSLWVLYNLLIIGGAIAVAAEVRQLRRSPRVSARLPAALRTADGHMHACTLSDFSDDSVGLELAAALDLAPGTAVSLLLHRGTREFVFEGRVQRSLGRRLGLRLDAMDTRRQIDFVQCTFARADAWLDWHDGFRLPSLVSSLLSVFALGGRGYLRLAEHPPAVLRPPLRQLGRLLRWLASFLPRPALPLRPAMRPSAPGSTP